MSKHKAKKKSRDKNPPIETRHDVIKQIKELVVEYDLTEMVERTGIPKTTLSDWRLKSIPISIDRAIKVLEAYGFEVELIDNREEEDEDDD